MPKRKNNRTGNQALVREINLSMIMRHLHHFAPISRASLAEITGLNKTTVSSLVQELIDYKFVRKIGRDSAGTGRPAILLELNPAAGCIVSAEIGVDFISVFCTDFAIKIIWSHQEHIQPDMGQKAIINRVLELLCQAEEAANPRPLLGVAIGVPGLVRQQDGTLLFAPNLGWRDIPVRDTFDQWFNIPIFVDNESNMAALGEYYFGAARDYQDVLCVSIGAGLGGAVIRDGQLLSGVSGLAGEFGHMTMEPEGQLCKCGNRGCWETLVSTTALFNYIQQAINRQKQSSLLIALTQGNLDCLNVPLIVEAAQLNDTLAQNALDKVGYYLGIGLASLVNALNPELVVIGGPLSIAGELLLPVVNAGLKKRALRWHEEAAKVVIAKHTSNACVIGGVVTVYQSVLAQPNRVRRPATLPKRVKDYSTVS